MLLCYNPTHVYQCVVLPNLVECISDGSRERTFRTVCMSVDRCNSEVRWPNVNPTGGEGRFQMRTVLDSRNNKSNKTQTARPKKWGIGRWEEQEQAQGKGTVVLGWLRWLLAGKVKRVELRPRGLGPSGPRPIRKRSWVRSPGKNDRTS